MPPRSEATTTSARSLISSVFRKREPKAAKDLYTGSDNDDEDVENDTGHYDKEQPLEQMRDTEDLATTVKKEEEEGSSSTEEAQRRPVARSSSRGASRSTSRSSRSTRRNKKPSRQSSQKIRNHLSANSLALKLESEKKNTTSSGEDHHHAEGDRSVATTSSRRSARPSGAGRHRLSSRSRSMNRSTDSFLGPGGLLGGDGEGEEPEEDPLDVSTKSETRLQRNRSKRVVGDRLRSRRQKPDQNFESNSTSTEANATPLSPGRISSRRYHSARVERGLTSRVPEGKTITKESTTTTTATEGEREEHLQNNRTSVPRSRSRSQPRRTKSLATSRNITSRSTQSSEHHQSMSGNSNNNVMSSAENKSSTTLNKPRRSRSKSANRNSRETTRPPSSKSTAAGAGKTMGTGSSSSRLRTRSRSVGSRQHGQSRRRGDTSVDRKKHNAQRAAAAAAKETTAADREKKVSSSDKRRPRTSSRHGERRNRVKPSTTKTTKDASEIDDTSKTNNSASARELDVSSKRENNNASNGALGDHMNDSIRMDVNNTSAASHGGSIRMENNGPVRSPRKKDNNASNSSIIDTGSLEGSMNLETGNGSGTMAVGNSFQTTGQETAPMETTREDALADSNKSMADSIISMPTDDNDWLGTRLGDAPVTPPGGMEDSINFEKDDSRLMVAGGARFYKEDAGASSDLSSSESTLSKTFGSSGSSFDLSYDESRKFSMAEVLQFDPTQDGLVQRVKQISSDKTGYEINGQSGQIGEIVDPVSNLQEPQKQEPLFNLLDDNPETEDLMEDRKQESPIGRRRRKNRFSLRRKSSEDANQQDDDKVVQDNAKDPEAVLADSLGYNDEQPAELLTQTQAKDKKRAMYKELLERVRSKGRSRSNGSESTAGDQDSGKEEPKTASPKQSEEPASDLLMLSPTAKEKKKKLYGMLDGNYVDSVGEQQTPNNTTKEKRKTLSKKASGYLQKMLNSSASNISPKEGDDDKSMVSSASSKSGRKSLTRMFSSNAKKRMNRGYLLESASVTSSLADQELLYDEVLKSK